MKKNIPKFPWTIGQVAKATGYKLQTMRYYEQMGLIPPPKRSEGNQRLYTQEHVDQLLFIRHCRELGFSLDKIQHMLMLAGDTDHSCEEVDQIAKLHLADVKNRISRLQRLEKELERIIGHCSENKVEKCLILEALRDHDQCEDKDHGGPLSLK
ncbi:MerR family transcriptional regulator [Magnetococcus sp. PR-3]|uniref:MerR family transcriptional regulator n=1 Tax=Magnetococcus sp. PR-3 TaxID=3120355 RepID=UPI002FCE2558